MVVAGSPHYIGAIALAGEAACRSGAGLVTIATTRRLIEMVAGRLREPTWQPLADADGAIAEAAWEAVSEVGGRLRQPAYWLRAWARAIVRGAFVRRLLASRSFSGLGH